MANINPITVIISITTVKESDKNENVLIKYKAKQVNPKTTAMLRMDLYNGSVSVNVQFIREDVS